MSIRRGIFRLEKLPSFLVAGALSRCHRRKLLPRPHHVHGLLHLRLRAELARVRHLTVRPATRETESLTVLP
jgi:hypothetical protein